MKIYFSEKKEKKNPETFRFVTLPLETQEKTSFHSWKFCKIVWNSKVKNKDPWKFHEFFLNTPGTHELPNI